jgi:HD-GYP domain-containing protein (c-di-GMP phosphodiesterase class II)
MTNSAGQLPPRTLLAKDMVMRNAAPLGSAALLGSLWLVYERRARRNTERLAAALLETLLFAIDANDRDTGLHARRVARYALLIGEAIGLSRNELRTIERVALFHDIGKIHGALLDIIRDNGKLSPEERRAIATHPDRGADVLAPLAAFFPELPDGVAAHHERWDGSGYPRCLRGGAIPLSARIVAIADTFDVMVSGRKYRSAKSLEAARNALVEGRGTQFDPVLVDVFLSKRVFERVEKLASRAPAVSAASADERRRGKKEDWPVPNPTFRWRSEAPALRPKGPEPQAQTE